MLCAVAALLFGKFVEILTNCMPPIGCYQNHFPGRACDRDIDVGRESGVCGREWLLDFDARTANRRATRRFRWQGPARPSIFRRYSGECEFAAG